VWARCDFVKTPTTNALSILSGNMLKHQTVDEWMLVYVCWQPYGKQYFLRTGAT